MNLASHGYFFKLEKESYSIRFDGGRGCQYGLCHKKLNKVSYLPRESPTTGFMLESRHQEIASLPQLQPFRRQRP